MRTPRAGPITGPRSVVAYRCRMKPPIAGAAANPDDYVVTTGAPIVSTHRGKKNLNVNAATANNRRFKAIGVRQGSGAGDYGQDTTINVATRALADVLCSKNSLKDARLGNIACVVDTINDDVDDKHIGPRPSKRDLVFLPPNSAKFSPIWDQLCDSYRAVLESYSIDGGIVLYDLCRRPLAITTFRHMLLSSSLDFEIYHIPSLSYLFNNIARATMFPNDKKIDPVTLITEMLTITRRNGAIDVKRADVDEVLSIVQQFPYHSLFSIPISVNLHYCVGAYTPHNMMYGAMDIAKSMIGTPASSVDIAIADLTKNVRVGEGMDRDEILDAVATHYGFGNDPGKIAHLRTMLYVQPEIRRAHMPYIDSENSFAFDNQQQTNTIYSMYFPNSDTTISMQWKEYVRKMLEEPGNIAKPLVYYATVCAFRAMLAAGHTCNHALDTIVPSIELVDNATVNPFDTGLDTIQPLDHSRVLGTLDRISDTDGVAAIHIKEIPHYCPKRPRGHNLIVDDINVDGIIYV
jgi:hypothetical protein